MVVYADVLFLINFVSTYIILWILGKFILKAQIKTIRLCIASAVGGFAAILMFSTEMNIFISYFFRALLAVIMFFIAYYEQKRQFMSGIIWLAVISMLMSGAVSATTSISGKTINMTSKSGVLYIDLPFRIFIPSFIAAYMIIVLFVNFVRLKRNKRCYTVTITFRGKKVTIPALFDSGNLLTEPITGKYVSIVEWDIVRKLLGVEYDLSEISTQAPMLKLWAVPFHSVGRNSGILLAFVVDKIQIAGDERIIENTMLGIYDGKLSKNNEYNALLNSALL